MSIEDGGQAFPCLDTDLTGLHIRDAGMTLRDYFAAKAIGPMSAEFHQDLRDDIIDEFSAYDIATSAYAMADAMLKARQP